VQSVFPDSVLGFIFAVPITDGRIHLILFVSIAGTVDRVLKIYALKK
jgi:hypothetical protein